MNTLDVINAATVPETSTDLKHESLDQQEPTNTTDNKSELISASSDMEDTPSIRITENIPPKQKQISCFQQYFGCLTTLCTVIKRPFSVLKNHSREKQFHAAIQKIKKDQNYTILLPPQTEHRKVLVLDLDQTLIHTTVMKPPLYHFVSEVGINKEIKIIYTTKRYGLECFLTEMSKLYELIIFTASPKVYADRMVDLIDPHRTISHRLYREHCIHYNKRMYLKNLRILGRNMSDIIFVDDNSLAELLQPATFYEIQPFYGKDDDHLFQLMAFLKHIHPNNEIVSVSDERKKFEKMEMLKEIQKLEEMYKREESIKLTINIDRREDRLKSSTNEGAALITNNDKEEQPKKSYFAEEAEEGEEATGSQQVKEV